MTRYFRIVIIQELHAMTKEPEAQNGFDLWSLSEPSNCRCVDCMVREIASTASEDVVDVSRVLAAMARTFEARCATCTAGLATP